MSYRIGVYQYRLLPPIDWDMDCREQLFRRKALWNALVELERQHRTRYQQLLAAQPEVAPSEAEMAALREQQAQLRGERKRLKAGDGVRSNKQRIGQINVELKELARQMQLLADRLKLLRKGLRAKISPLLKELTGWHQTEVKRIAKDSKLYWPNANAVLGAYDTARNRAMREGAELRFHPFTGEGSFNIQFIGGVSLDDLESGEHAMAQLDMRSQPVPRKPRRDGGPPGRAGKPLPRLSITAYMRPDGSRFGAHRKLTFPVLLDRPLPDELRRGGEDCRIQEIIITARKVATKLRWHAVVKFRLPEVPQPIHPHPERRCALNLGFRERPGGNLRVAMLYDGERYREILLNAQSPEAPAGGWSRHRGGQPRAPWRTRLERDVNAVRSSRDEHFDRMVALLKGAWRGRPTGTPTALAERLTHLLALPEGKRFASRKLAAVALLWRREHHDYWPEMCQMLEAWRREDKRWLEIEAHGRDRIHGARNHEYRKLARDLAHLHGEIRIGKIDLKGLAKLESAGGQETELARKARSNRQQASLHELQREIIQQAAKTGARVVFIEAPYTPICHTCGQRMAVEADLMVSCPQGHVWDQDEVATRNIYGALAPAPKEPAPAAKKPRLTRSERMRAARARKKDATASDAM